jgi:hypothetical protein
MHPAFDDLRVVVLSSGPAQAGYGRPVLTPPTDFEGYRVVQYSSYSQRQEESWASEFE